MIILSENIRTVYTYDCYVCKVKTDVIDPPGLSKKLEITDKIPDIHEIHIDWSAFNCPKCGSSNVKVSFCLQAESN